MAEEINQEKFEKMWNKILNYEKNEGMTVNDKTAAEKIVKIIDEVFKECL